MATEGDVDSSRDALSPEALSGQLDVQALLQETEEHEALRWLEWALWRCQYWKLSDAEVLGRLEAILSDGDRSGLLKEIERRLDGWSRMSERRLCAVLSRLETRYYLPGWEARAVDGVLQRLLHRMSTKSARSLAARCANSSRLLRRRAAWRFYRERGLDPEASALIQRHLGSTVDRELVSLAVSDPALVATIGLGPLLTVADGFYWRARVLESALAHGSVNLASVLDEYPAEVLFAIRRRGAMEQLGLVHEALSRYSDDPRVVTGAIQAFAAFQDAAGLESAEDAGRTILGRASERQPWTPLAD